MAKRQTKAAKEAAEIEALKVRLRDIAHGAYGPYIPLDFDGTDFSGMASEMGLDAFGRWLGGIKNALLLEEKDHDLIGPIHMEEFDSIEKAAKHLHGWGIRA